MDKIEVTNGAVDPDHYGPIGDAARGIASYCDDPQRVHVYTAAFDAIKDILATRTDATPVATDVAALVEAEREAIINWLRGGAGTDTTTLDRSMRILFLRGLHGYADAIERGDHIAPFTKGQNDE